MGHTGAPPISFVPCGCAYNTCNALQCQSYLLDLCGVLVGSSDQINPFCAMRRCLWLLVVGKHVMHAKHAWHACGTRQGYQGLWQQPRPPDASAACLLSLRQTLLVNVLVRA